MAGIERKYSKTARLNDRLRKVRSVLFITLWLNLAVSGSKLVVGLLIGSMGMAADGLHSLSDASSNIIGLIGMNAAGKPPDKSHPYGHAKYETFAALFIGAMLFFMCFELLMGAYKRLNGPPQAIEAGAAGFGVMVLTVGVNLFVSTYEARKGRELTSDFLLADSQHTRSDIFASLAVITGLAGAKMGFPSADPIAAGIVAVMIAYAGWGIIKRSSDVLCDASMVEADRVTEICRAVPGVLRCHRVRSRGREDQVLIDLRVHVDPKLPTEEAHRIAHEVENRIRAEFGEVRDVVVHIEPEGPIDRR
ncbi:MAG TPA: cation diffusion facilitator family transporter [Nitrospirota bacterium]|jgi:cation diffusion facilitator family transporter